MKLKPFQLTRFFLLTWIDFVVQISRNAVVVCRGSRYAEFSNREAPHKGG
jgi:hypothetical protein